MEIDTNEENVSVEFNKEDEGKRRKRRRSSFIDKSRMGSSDVTGVHGDNDNSVMNEVVLKDVEKENDEWKKIYLQMLEDEEKDWQNVFWNMKYKYQETLKKSKKPQLIDNSCVKFLPPEKVKFLNDAGVHKRVIKQLDTLIESTAINSKLRTMLSTAASKSIKYNFNGLKQMRQKIYLDTIETPYSNIILSGNEDEGDALEPFLCNDSMMQTS